MIARAMLYDIIYALAARDGRDKVLFGPYAPLAHQAIERSLAGTAFPEIWFEMPLAGEPWFDVHALASAADLSPDMSFDPETTGGYPETFAWFAHQQNGVRQLALSWDVSSGDIDVPAIQLLVSVDDPSITCGFLEAAGRPDAIEAYRTFVGRIPESWFACYAGVFRERPGHHLRVECIPSSMAQRAYARDASLLASQLRATGLQQVDEQLVAACQKLADTPFQLEFQFDVDETGSAGPTLGVSLRFAGPPGSSEWQFFDVDGAAGVLMRQLEAQGLVDGRWKRLAETMYAQRVKLGGESCLIYCYPAFVKLRWREGQWVDAKTYLIAGVD